MPKRFWVIGGEYDGPDFRALIPGTETMAGPFEDERKAKTEWTRLSGRPERSGCATLRYSIAAERLHRTVPAWLDPGTGRFSCDRRVIAPDRTGLEADRTG